MAIMKTRMIGEEPQAAFAGRRGTKLPGLFAVLWFSSLALNACTEVSSSPGRNEERTRYALDVSESIVSVSLEGSGSLCQMESCWIKVTVAGGGQVQLTDERGETNALLSESDLQAFRNLTESELLLEILSADYLQCQGGGTFDSSVALGVVWSDGTERTTDVGGCLIGIGPNPIARIGYFLIHVLQTYRVCPEPNSSAGAGGGVGGSRALCQ